jgi:opacity protein-like surface antigen
LNIKFIRQTLFLAAFTSTLPVSALAEKNGFYIGAGAGGARVESSLTDLGIVPDDSNDLTLQTDDVSGSDIAYKTFIGYRIFDFLAVEAAYINMGEAEENTCYIFTQQDVDAFRAANGGDDPPYSAGDCQDREWSARVEPAGFELSALGIWPVSENWELFGKAGVFIYDMDVTGRDQIGEMVPGQILVIPPGFVVIPDGSNACNGDPQNPDPSLGPVGTGFGCAASKSHDGTDLTLGVGANVQVTDYISVRSELQWFDIDNTDDVWMASLSAIYSF